MRNLLALHRTRWSNTIAFTCLFKGSVSSRSEQTFNRAWNRCPSLRWIVTENYWLILCSSNSNMTLSCGGIILSHWVNLKLALRFHEQKGSNWPWDKELLFISHVLALVLISNVTIDIMIIYWWKDLYFRKSGLAQLQEWNSSPAAFTVLNCQVKLSSS